MKFLKKSSCRSLIASSKKLKKHRSKGKEQIPVQPLDESKQNNRDYILKPFSESNHRQRHDMPMKNSSGPAKEPQLPYAPDLEPTGITQFQSSIKDLEFEFSNYISSIENRLCSDIKDLFLDVPCGFKLKPVKRSRSCINSAVQ